MAHSDHPPFGSFLEPQSNGDGSSYLFEPEKIQEEMEANGRVGRIKREYVRQERELSQKLSDLAELLEEEGFDVERFRFGLSQEQFFWLHSEKGTIKKHLRGVAIGSYR